jgi:hypothetical protein
MSQTSEKSARGGVETHRYRVVPKRGTSVVNTPPQVWRVAAGLNCQIRNSEQ